MTEFDAALQRLRTILAGGEVRAALAFLNSRTGHRFTSLYRFDDAMLRNVHFYDRDNPQQASAEDIPVLASYCVFVRDRGVTFDVSDSLADERVAGHPKQPRIRAYCGVPLLDELGGMFGTICHFDFEPLPISDGNVALMEAIAPLLQRCCTAQAVAPESPVPGADRDDASMLAIYGNTAYPSPSKRPAGPPRLDA